MNKIGILAIALVLVSSGINAQCNEIKTALKELNNNQLKESVLSLDSANKLIIEQGISNIDEKCMAKYYFARGTTNFELAKKEEDITAKVAAFAKSEENYNNFFKNNQKPDDLLKLAESNYNSLAIEYINVGVDLYQKQDYEKALEFTEKGIEIKLKSTEKSVDNQDLFNAMICSKMALKYEKALVYADTLINSKKSTPDKILEYKTQKVEILSALGKNKEAIDLIIQLKTINPSNVNLQLTELQLYLNENNNENALILLESLTQQINNREDLFVVKAQLHFQKSQMGEAISAYNKALQLNPKSESALYGLAVVHVNQANAYIESIKNVKQQNVLEAENKLNTYYNSAIMYLDRLLAVNPNDRDSISALISIYKSMGDEVKVKVYQDKLNSLK
jgi:tetratricopeptide (TPR) repeat protein